MNLPITSQHGTLASPISMLSLSSPAAGETPSSKRRREEFERNARAASSSETERGLVLPTGANIATSAALGGGQHHQAGPAPPGGSSSAPQGGDPATAALISDMHRELADLRAKVAARRELEKSQDLHVDPVTRLITILPPKIHTDSAPSPSRAASKSPAATPPPRSAKSSVRAHRKKRSTTPAFRTPSSSSIISEKLGESAGDEDTVGAGAGGLGLDDVHAAVAAEKKKDGGPLIEGPPPHLAGAAN